jgi:hypothetical protein
MTNAVTVEALRACREFLVGMTKPAAAGMGTISSYHPCHALIDMIDRALLAQPAPNGDDLPPGWLTQGPLTHTERDGGKK